MSIENEKVEKHFILKVDLVICGSGEPGRCAAWQNNESIFYQKALHRVRFLDGSNPCYYMYYLRYAAQTGQFKPFFTGTEVKHSTGQSLVKMQVPTASQEKQNEIINQIKSHLSVCDSIDQTVNTALRQVDSICRSVLKKSF